MEQRQRGTVSGHTFKADDNLQIESMSVLHGPILSISL